MPKIYGGLAGFFICFHQQSLFLSPINYLVLCVYGWSLILILIKPLHTHTDIKCAIALILLNDVIEWSIETWHCVHVLNNSRVKQAAWAFRINIAHHLKSERHLISLLYHPPGSKKDMNWEVWKYCWARSKTFSLRQSMLLSEVWDSKIFY